MSEEIDRILDKTFEDLRRRIKNVLVKQEKRILRENGINPNRKVVDEKEKDKKKRGHRKKDTSSSDQSSE